MSTNWVQVAEPGPRVFVYASRVELDSLRSTWKLFRHHVRNASALSDHPGFLGHRMRIQITKKVVWTLTHWDHEWSARLFTPSGVEDVREAELHRVNARLVGRDCDYDLAPQDFDEVARWMDLE